MNLLDLIKKNNKCPLCDEVLDCRLNLETHEGNSLSFTMKDASYPIKFSRPICFEAPLDAVITEDNFLSVEASELSIGKFTLGAVCGCGNYCISFLDAYCPVKCNNAVLNFSHIIKISERVSVDDLVIKNTTLADSEFGSTFVYQKAKSVWHNEKFLFSMNKKPASYWPLKDPKELKNKINKLLLLI